MAASILFYCLKPVASSSGLGPGPQGLVHRGLGAQAQGAWPIGAWPIGQIETKDQEAWGLSQGPGP